MLGPLELRADGQRVTRAELRRARVRELLSVLVVERSVTRERAMDVLWPDFDADVVARNLRVTLTHLRRLLEPERPPGEAGFHLRVDSTTIQLFASPKLLVDLWEMTALRASAAAARTSGDIDRAIELYDAASTLLRGLLLVDVGRLAGFDDEIERARLSHVSALLSVVNCASPRVLRGRPRRTPSGRSPSTPTSSGPTGWRSWPTCTVTSPAALPRPSPERRTRSTNWVSTRSRRRRC